MVFLLQLLSKSLEWMADCHSKLRNKFKTFDRQSLQDNLSAYSMRKQNSKRKQIKLPKSMFAVTRAKRNHDANFSNTSTGNTKPTEATDFPTLSNPEENASFKIFRDKN